MPRLTFANVRRWQRQTEFTHAACHARWRKSPGHAYNPLFIFAGVGAR